MNGVRGSSDVTAEHVTAPGPGATDSICSKSSETVRTAQTAFQTTNKGCCLAIETQHRDRTTKPGIGLAWHASKYKRHKNTIKGTTTQTDNPQRLTTVGSGILMYLCQKHD